MTSSGPQPLNMKSVSFQSMPSSVNGGGGGHPALNHVNVLGPSNVMYCEKCGFATSDAEVFKKHMIEHMGTRFYCFYCNNVSFSEAELNTHLKQHTSKYPFKCPHCGQGYMRRLCLVKHIDRLHRDVIGYGPPKTGTAKIPQVSVSSALPSVPSDPLSVRPVVRVTVPTPSVPTTFRLGKDEPRAKTLDTSVSNAATNGNAERLSPLNGLIQHNRALTVSLPEEVTIPAGCLVELVEVKTVNGTKELKLRLVSQQENESVIKDARTTVSQNSALGKQLSSTLNHPNTAKSMNVGPCTVNRKQYETKTVTLERPLAVPVNLSNNYSSQISKDKSSGLKRTSQEIINLDSTEIPTKLPKSILNPVREGNSGIQLPQREPVSHKTAAPSAVNPSRVANRLPGTLHIENMAARLCQRVADERKTLIPEHSKSIQPRRVSDLKNIPRDASLAVKLESVDVRLKSNVASKALGLNQQSLKSASPSVSLPSAAVAQVRPPAISLCKDKVAHPSFPVPRTLNEPSPFKTSVLSNRTNSKMSTWDQDGRSGERVAERRTSEPESFPVISSVFSLSQQPEEVQSSIKPLVMALRGIVMDKSNSPGSTTQEDVKEQGKEVSTSGQRAQPVAKVEPVIRKTESKEQTSQPVKEEECHKKIQDPPELTQNQVKEEKTATATPNEKNPVKEEKTATATANEKNHVKEEKTATTTTNEKNHVKEEKTATATPKEKNKCSPISKPSTDEESISKDTAPADAPVTQVPLQDTVKTLDDISSKFLTVSLKRVQVGVWKKNKKGLKIRISKCKTQVPDGLTDYTVIYPMPLKVDQPVKRPGPNQPVVVLNHPKPRVSSSTQGAMADCLADTGAPETVPKCQILKMRLGKVVGQKYEVMGCTVGAFP